MDVLGLYILLLNEKAAHDKTKIKAQEGKKQDSPGQYEQKTAYERGSYHALTWAADIAKTYLRGRDVDIPKLHDHKNGG